ncbi:MAG: hypothetical protein QF440_04350 [Candidatus Thalassarchaeaceae archaeon]|nr:hypothetical protein [Candidatus Thalassarchaeaceae archaeon]
MGIFSKLFGGKSETELVESESSRRLEALSGHYIDSTLIPDEAVPIEEDAWTLAPSPTRARVGTTGAEPMIKEEPAPQGVAAIDTKEIEQKMDNRFDRIEATMAMMDARLTQIRETTETSHILPTDTLVTAEEDSEEDSEGQQSDSDEGESTSISQTVSLLDLYEDRVADLNPFLERRPGDQDAGLSVTTSEIAALLLDNLSGPATTTFLVKAKESGTISAAETKELGGLIQLADPAVNNNGGEHLPHRELLMFNAMIEAWRVAKTNDEGA